MHPLPTYSALLCHSSTVPGGGAPLDFLMARDAWANGSSGLVPGNSPPLVSWSNYECLGERERERERERESILSCVGV